MDALGLTNYAIERFALAGNASDWISANRADRRGRRAQDLGEPSRDRHGHASTTT
jgi:hypothetical protein